MKILLLTTSTHGGGAAHAALRLFRTLRHEGVEVRLLSLHPATALGEDVSALADAPLTRLPAAGYKALERLELLCHLGGKRTNLWRLSTASYGYDLSQHPWVEWADVLHLHWVHHGMMSLKGLRRLVALGKPTCWTMHDLWAVTGLCHLPLLFLGYRAEPCSRLSLGCGACPLLGSRQTNDISARLRREKQSLLQPNVHLLCVSTAERDLALEAIGESRVGSLRLTPPPLDTEQWWAMAEQARRASGAPSWYRPERLYLVVAAARIDDEVKSPRLLIDILDCFQRLDARVGERLTLVLAGEIRQPELFDRLNVEQVRLGLLGSAQELASVYAYATAVLSTSLYETFGQSLSEALATGTPVLAWRAGGTADIVQDGVNGCLVAPYDVEAYAQSILTLLRLIDLGQVTEATCRRSVERFAAARSAALHRAIYTDILNHHTNK